MIILKRFIDPLRIGPMTYEISLRITGDRRRTANFSRHLVFRGTTLPGLEAIGRSAQLRALPVDMLFCLDALGNTDS